MVKIGMYLPETLPSQFHTLLICFRVRRLVSVTAILRDGMINNHSPEAREIVGKKWLSA